MESISAMNKRGLQREKERALAEKFPKLKELGIYARQVAHRLYPQLYNPLTQSKRLSWPKSVFKFDSEKKRNRWRIRLLKFADELNGDVVPVLGAMCSKLGAPYPQFDTVVPKIKKMVSLLTAPKKPYHHVLDGFSRSNRSHRPKRNEDRDWKVCSLSVLFRERTERPHNSLVADIINWYSNDKLGLAADDVKKIVLRFYQKPRPTP